MKIRAQRTPPRRVLWGTAASPVGKLVVGLTEKGEVCRASFLGARNAIDIIEEWQMDWNRTSFTIGAVPKDILKLPVLVIGTEFQKDAWQAMMRIPHGEVISYGDIARKIGAPRAARAVGAACGKNCIAYIIPCHRVVSSNGLGGYGPGGLDTKRALLKMEGVDY